jgi:hypothetical protein
MGPQPGSISLYITVAKSIYQQVVVDCGLGFYCLSFSFVMCWVYSGLNIQYMGGPLLSELVVNLNKTVATLHAQNLER